MLYQMYDEATGKKSKTTRTGAAPGALDKKPKATKAGEHGSPELFPVACSSPCKSSRSNQGWMSFVCQIQRWVNSVSVVYQHLH